MSAVDALVFALLGAGAMWAVPRLWVWRPPRPATMRLGVAPLQEREMQTALLACPELTWQAVHQCIDSQRAKCLDDTTDPERQGHPSAIYAAGAAENLRELQGFLIAQREKAKTIKVRAA